MDDYPPNAKPITNYTQYAPSNVQYPQQTYVQQYPQYTASQSYTQPQYGVQPSQPIVAGGYPQQVVYVPTTVVQTQVVSGPRFNPNCPKCRGTGIRKKGKSCKECYLSAGICFECGGTGSHKGKACKVCQYRNNGGVCPLCFLRKHLTFKKKACVLCRFVQKHTS